MIIVNTTFILHNSIDADMRGWLRQVYAASADKYRVNDKPVLYTRVLDGNTSDSTSYAIHIHFPDIAAAKKWNEGVGQSLRSIASKRWGEKALSFHTYLEVEE